MENKTSIAQGYASAAVISVYCAFKNKGCTFQATSRSS